MTDKSETKKPSPSAKPAPKDIPCVPRDMVPSGTRKGGYETR